MPQGRFDHIQRILIRSANWVGDAVMTTPAVRAIRRNFPAAHITVLAKPWVIPVFEHSPDVDRIMVYQADGRHGGRTGLWRLSRDIRRQRFDLAVLFQNAFEAALLAFMARVPRRMGFTTDGRTLLLNERIRTWRPLKHGHLIDYYLGLLAGAGLTVYGRDLVLEITRSERDAAQQDLERHGLVSGGPLVGLNPGAAFGTAKRWLPERFAQLGHRLVSQSSARVLIFGGPGEAELGSRMAADIGPGCVDLSGRTSLRQAMALMSHCDVFVTNDSGLMHVAAALNIPQVAIIGPTDHTATGPSNAASRILHAADACPHSPCMKPHCPEDHRCMTAVSVDEVMQAALELLNQGGMR